MQRHAEPIFPLRDAWLPILPVVPLVLSAVLLSWLIDAARKLDFLTILPVHFVALPQREYIHLGDMLTYYSLAAFHTLLCAAVVATFTTWMLRLPAQRFRGTAIFLAVVSLLIVIIVIFFGVFANQQVLVQLGYKVTCELIDTADLATELTPLGCWTAGINRLTWLAWLPTFSGMVTVAFAAAFAYATARGLPPTDDKNARNTSVWREAVDFRVKALQRSVYLLSAVLVSSTVTITAFAHLPVGLLANSDEAFPLATAVSKYASGLSTFWGTVFSFTLIFTFAVPALLVLREAYGGDSAVHDGVDFRLWLNEHVFQSVKRQLGTMLSLLAPLLVGPLSSLLSSFAQF